MREEYDIENLNPRRNPYAEKLKKKQITINLDTAVVDYFKQLSVENGIPYQTLINLYLLDCTNNQKHLNISWT
ncbi:MAG: BrnA antitoxin family protein [Ruminococcus sp.]|nr:BrnA antitoxin family protein [Ruminococcus sp.]